MPSPDQKDGVPEVSSSKDAKLAKKVRDADVVILVKKQVDEKGDVIGAGAIAWSHEFGGPLPYTIEAAFTGEEDGDPNGLFRQVTVRAGWNRADWRKLDRSALNMADESEV